jgi:23S rRNA (cytidine1920-2'-O)/16S rRNA (cytidine1409-2'-O)-methyltransferase
MLVENKFFESRSKAQAAIKESLVFYDGELIEKSNHEINEDQFSVQSVEIKESALTKYVSRGGVKIEGALNHIKIDVRGLVILDVGVSTGGFSDCLLQKGAKFVVGIDVGTRQVHKKLQSELNFKSIEGINIKDVNKSFFIKHNVPEEFDLIVGDVSFMSATQVFPVIKKFLKAQGKVLFLIKPQFEFDKKVRLKKGIVKEADNFRKVEEKIKESILKNGFKLEDYFPSQLKGSDGNQEFFVYASQN